MQPYTFKQNKYLLHYQKLTSKITNIQRSKNNGIYYEQHHILPKSLGGNNSKLNLILLTPKEHFVAHLLLVRIVQDSDTYRMVNAIRRFTNKVKTSTEFGLLRSTISKFSRGTLNPSYGKIWAHNIKTLDIIYIQKEQFALLPNTEFKKGLPYQRGGHKNTVWVNNSNKEAIIQKTDIDTYQSQGWKLGRLHPCGVEQMKHASSFRHTTEKDMQHSQKLIGRIAIKHMQSGKVKRIHPSDLTKYQNLGFSKDAIITLTVSNKCQIEGVQYDSTRDAANKLKLPETTVYYRVSCKNEKWKEWKRL